MDKWFDAQIRPMLASLSSEPFDSPDHIYEAKWDGTRCLAFVSSTGLRLQDRSLQDTTAYYPELTSLMGSLNAESAVLDGVLLVLEGGRPSMSRLAERESLSDATLAEHMARRSPVTFIVFDILYLNGESVMERPLHGRKALLREALRQSARVVLGTWVPDKGVAFLNQVARLGLNGVIAKEKDSAYLPGSRGTAWLKMQRFKVQDCLICGYTEGQGRREGLLGSLVLGVYYRDYLVHIGQVGSGYDENTLRYLHERLLPLRTPDCPFPHLPRIERPTTWVQPELVCEVQYAEWTNDCKLRSPRFVRLRENKRVEDCQIEEVCQGLARQTDLLSARLTG